MDTIKLQQAGLDERESKIYLALLELKEAGVSNISKKTGVNRSLLYFVLSDIEKKGFVSYIIRNNVRYYKPIEPDKILSLLKEKEKTFEEILPDLVLLHKMKKDRPQIEILEGKEGIKTILNEILRLKKDWFAFNAPGKSPEILGHIADTFEIQRQKKKIKLKVIFLKTEKGLLAGKRFLKMTHTQVKYMPEEYESPASNYIYGDRVAILFWYKEFPFAVRIIDKNLADSYRKYFDALWKISEKRPQLPK